LYSKYRERRGTKLENDQHDCGASDERADEAQAGEAKRSDAGIGAGYGYGDPQARQKTHCKDELCRVPVHALLHCPTAARDILEFIEPGAEGTARGVVPELIAGPSADGAGEQNGYRIQPAERSGDNRTHINDFALDSSRYKDA